MHTVSEVVANRLCVSCGACAVAAGAASLTLRYDKKLALHVPYVKFRATAADSEAAFAVCPGKGIEIMRLAETVRSSKAAYDVHLGYVLEACCARATNTQFAARASSGGIMTSVAWHLLSSGQATCVVSTGFTYGSEGPRGQARIVRDLAGLIECQGSKYCPVSMHEVLEALRDRDERAAFIGTPCQIAALRMLVERLPWLKRQIVFVIGCFCGGMKDYRELDALIRRQGVKPCDVVRFSFRGGGQPGRMLIEDRHGTVKTRPYPDYVTDTGYKKLERCRLCIDGTAELADLACGDAWLPRFGQSGHGWSVAIARNEKAAAVLHDLRDRGLIETQGISLPEIRISQRSNLTSKKARQLARRRFYRLLGRGIPGYDGGMPTGRTSVWLEARVHCRHALLRSLEATGLYWPFIRCARWARGSNMYRRRPRSNGGEG